MIWDVLSLDACKVKKIPYILIGNTQKQTPSIWHWKWPVKMVRTNFVQILSSLSMACPFLILKSNSPMRFEMGKQEFSRSKTELDNALKIASSVALIILPSSLPFLITCPTSADKVNKNRVLTTFQMPIQKLSLMPLKKNDKQILFVLLQP